jgi:hypothetical protein
MSERLEPAETSRTASHGCPRSINQLKQIVIPSLPAQQAQPRHLLFRFRTTIVISSY